MKQTITINNAQIIDGKIEIEITKEMARKVLEESEEIQAGDNYYYTNTEGEIDQEIWENHSTDLYRKNTDNCCPLKSYNLDRAKEYFNKRDARRAAEYRIKKAIEKMNGDIERDSDVTYIIQNDSFMCISVKYGFISPKHLHFNHSIGDYMLEHHAEDYKIYWGIE